MAINSNWTVCFHCGGKTYAPDDLDEPLCSDCQDAEDAILEELFSIESTFQKAGLVEVQEWEQV